MNSLDIINSITHYLNQQPVDPTTEKSERYAVDLGSIKDLLEATISPEVKIRVTLRSCDLGVKVTMEQGIELAHFLIKREQYGKAIAVDIKLKSYSMLLNHIAN